MSDNNQNEMHASEVIAESASEATAHEVIICGYSSHNVVSGVYGEAETILRHTAEDTTYRITVVHDQSANAYFVAVITEVDGVPNKSHESTLTFGYVYDPENPVTRRMALLAANNEAVQRLGHLL